MSGPWPSKSVFPFVTRALTILMVPAVFACGSDDSPTDTQDPSITVSTSPTSASVEQGQDTDVTVTVTGSGGFSGTASVSVESPPTGVGATISDVQASGGTTTATLTLAVGVSAAPGDYSLTVQATGTGVDATTTTFSLTVTAAPAYELTATPAEVVVAQGNQGATEIGLQRTNFTGEVTLSAEGLPTDVTAAFDPDPVSGASSQMTVTVPETVPAGSYELTVRGTATGLDDRTVAVTLTVADATASYVLSVEPSSITLDQGATGTVDVALSRIGGFAGSVDLSLEGAPEGVTGSFDPDPTGGSASVLTLVVGSSTSPGTYELTVRGTADGLADETATVSLTVPTPPGFTLAAITALSLQQGQSGVRTVTIERSGGFTGEVTVAVTGLPTGITASVDPTTTTGTSVDVTVSVGGSVSPGAYQLTVVGSASGLVDSSQPLDVSVVGVAGTDITLDFGQCLAAERPVWFAYRDGDTSPWTQVAGVGDAYSFAVSGSDVAVALTTVASASESSVVALYATTTELETITSDDLCDVVPTGKTVSASVAGLNESGDIANLTLGSSTTQAFLNGPVEFAGVPDGNLHLVGYKATTGNIADLMTISRNIEPADGADIGTFDFATSGFAPESATITPSGAGSAVFWDVEYVTSPSTGVCYYAPLVSGFVNPAGPFTARGAPDAQMQTGEFHGVTLTGGGSSGLNSVSETFTSLSADRTIDFGPSLNSPTITDVTGDASYRRVRADVTLPAEYNSTATLAVADDQGDRSISVLATPGWQSQSSISLETPNFTDTGGWDATWVPGSTEAVQWFLSAVGESGVECTDGYREFTTYELGALP